MVSKRRLTRSIMPLSHISPNELLEAMPDANVIIDMLGNILYANTAFLNLVGYDRDEVVRENIIHFLLDDSVFRECLVSVEAAGHCQDQETYFLHRDGHMIHTVKNVRILSDSEEPLVLATIRDLSAVDSKYKALEKTHTRTERSVEHLSKIVNAKEQELHTTRAQLEEILGAINEIIWYIDNRTMQVRYVSRAVETVFGIPQQEFVSKPGLWQQMVYEDDREQVDAFFAQINDAVSHTIDFRIVRSDGKVRWLNNRITHHPDLQLFIGVTYDITESKSAQDLIEFLAYHDPLTRLPNRVYLSEKIDKCLARAGVIHHTVAVLFLDLDNFKYVNDSKGHEVGDELLVQIARRMLAALPAKTELSRFGGDEFIILISDIQDNADIDSCCQRILGCFTDAFAVGDEEFFLTASVGTALYPEDAATASDLIKHADTAMYAAKRSGKNQFRYYHPRMDNRVKEFLRIEHLIREGIREEYFMLHFQPLVDADTRALRGFEALLRYAKPGGESLTPDEFIPVAERTGEIILLSETVFKQACAFARQLKGMTGVWLPVSVNLSARQFQDQNLLSTLQNCIRTYEIPPHALTLEVTESVIMKNIERVSLELEAMRAAGFKIALDDFGTGYSSLEYLAKLPIDTLKIDKSFISALFENPQNRHLVRAVTTMAQAMQMNVTAEGVENDRQAEFLLRHGAQMLQGHLFSEPLSAEQVESKVRESAPYFTPGTVTI
jgi:diguanylate cyclase (GGDEF)-like protein/PAS domain S-box-containing protein